MTKRQDKTKPPLLQTFEFVAEVWPQKPKTEAMRDKGRMPITVRYLTTLPFAKVRKTVRNQLRARTNYFEISEETIITEMLPKRCPRCQNKQYMVVDNTHFRCEKCLIDIYLEKGD